MVALERTEDLRMMDSGGEKRVVLRMRPDSYPGGKEGR